MTSLSSSVKASLLTIDSTVALNLSAESFSPSAAIPTITAGRLLPSVFCESVSSRLPSSDFKNSLSLGKAAVSFICLEERAKHGVEGIDDDLDDAVFRCLWKLLPQAKKPHKDFGNEFEHRASSDLIDGIAMALSDELEKS